MENYFWNTEEENSIKKLYILVIYDIVEISEESGLRRK